MTDSNLLTQQPTEAEVRARCERAGVLPHELLEDPEHGLLISSSGVQKLKALGTNAYVVALIGQEATRVARAQIKMVK
jgi:hypothetical protein